MALNTLKYNHVMTLGSKVVVILFRQEQTIHYTHNTKLTTTKAGNQKGNAHHAGHLWHTQKNNYLTIC